MLLTMSKTKTVHSCVDCGTAHPKWTGQCAGCGGWNTLVEELLGELARPGAPPAAAMSSLDLLGDIDALLAAPQTTGIAELDRVLGGGIVAGSVTLLGGEPGIGKSTLLLQLLASWPGTTLYVSAEESAQQVRLRAERLAAVRPELWLATETTLGGVLAAIERTSPSLVVVDSIQTIADERTSSSAGSVTQVRECAQALVIDAKRRGVPIVLVGHVTKDGTLAGPRVLEHVVDTVLSFEGERHHALRLLRAVKHRFGSTDELGLFEMTAAGLQGVADPSKLFLADRRAGVAGSVVVAAMEGQRPLLVEVQALTVPIPQGTPARRNAQGLDGGRLALLLAVLERRAGLRVTTEDVYASTAGGVRLVEPGVDLAVAMAVASATTDRVVGPDVVVMGEIGLGGEVRQVSHARRRLGEAARIGFRRAIVPASSPPCDGLEVIRVGTVAEALAVRVSWTAGAPGPAGRPPSIDGWPTGIAAPTTRSATRSPRSLPARRCVTGSTGSCGRRPARSSCWTTDRGCWPSARAVSSSMPPTARNGCRSWRRWTVRSSSRRTAAGSPGPTCTSSPIRRCPTTETGTRHRTAERVARSLGVPVVSASEEMGVINVYAGGSKHQLQDISRLLDRANQALQTLERYKVRLDDAIANLTGVELEDVVSLRDVVAVVQRGEMVHRISDEIETMIIELGVDARLLRLQLDELYGDIDDEIDLVVADYLPPGRTAVDTQAEMSRLSDDEVLDLRAAAATLHRGWRQPRPRPGGRTEGTAAAAPGAPAADRAGRRDRRPLRRAGQAAAGDDRRPHGRVRRRPRAGDVDQGHARARHRVDDPRPVQLSGRAVARPVSAECRRPRRTARRRRARRPPGPP